MLFFTKRRQFSISMALLMLVSICLPILVSAASYFNVVYDSKTGEIYSYVYSDQPSVSLNVYDSVYGSVYNAYTNQKPTSVRNLFYPNPNGSDVNNYIYYYETKNVIQAGLIPSYSTLTDGVGTYQTGSASVLNSVYMYSFIHNLQAPTGLAAVTGVYQQDSTSMHGMKITWNSVQDDWLLGYNVYINGDKYNETPLKTTNYTIFKYELNSTYSISVKSVDKFGKESEDSAPTIFTTPPIDYAKVQGSFNITNVSLPKGQVTVKDLEGKSLYQLTYHAPVVKMATDKGEFSISIIKNDTGETGLFYSIDLPANTDYYLQYSDDEHEISIRLNTSYPYQMISQKDLTAHAFEYNPNVPSNRDFLGTPTFYFNKKPAGSFLQPNEPILSFMPSANQGKRLYVSFPYDKPISSNNSSKLDITKMAPSDFILINTSTNTQVPVDYLDVYPEGSYMFFTFSKELDAGSTYKLSMSSQSSGNEIKLPNWAGSEYSVLMSLDTKNGYSVNGFGSSFVSIGTTPDAPQALSMKRRSVGMTLSWEPVVGAVSYNFYKLKYGTNKGFVKINSTPIVGNEFVYDDAQEYQEEHYFVTAVDSQGRESSASNVLVSNNSNFTTNFKFHTDNLNTNYTLKPNDPIVTFQPTMPGADQLFLTLPYDDKGTSLNRSNVKIDQLNPSDFTLTNNLTGSTIPINGINYKYNNGSQQKGLILSLGSGLQTYDGIKNAFTSYTLKMSASSGGNEIQLPALATNTAKATLSTYESISGVLHNIDTVYNLTFTAPAIGGGGGPIFLPPTKPVTPEQNKSEPVVLDPKNDGKLTKENSPEGKETVKFSLDPDKLNKALESLKNKDREDRIVSINVQTDGASTAKVEFPAKSIKDNASENSGESSIITIKSDIATFNIPLSVLNTAGLLTNEDNAFITVQISKAPESVNQNIFNNNENIKLMADPVEFTITVSTRNGETKTLSQFNVYVERSIELQSGGTHLAGVMVDPITGELSPIPTTFTIVDGKTIATLKSTHNSMYTVIDSTKAFTDLNGHWAKNDIELLASKQIVKGLSDTAFEPEQEVTRAQFASMLINALGLLPNPEAAKPFSDIKSTDWFAGPVGAAVKAGLVDGFDSTHFAPNANISREQMAVMISRAIRFTATNKDHTLAQISLLSSFGDAAQISEWAKTAVTETVNLKIILGLTETTFAPTQNATRAQAITMLRRMMKVTELID